MNKTICLKLKKMSYNYIILLLLLLKLYQVFINSYIQYIAHNFLKAFICTRIKL